MEADERDGRRVALTGGIASGKSTVAGMFRELGAEIIDADQAARKAVIPGAGGWIKLKGLLGPDYFDRRGNLFRSRLRSRIIEDSGLRRRIDELLHPEIVALMDDKWRRIRQRNPGAPILFDIPLLFESGLAEGFETVIVVYVPPKIQLRRLMDRDRVSLQEARRTLAMQMDLEAKRRLADIVIDNSGSLSLTREQVVKTWRRLFETPQTDRHG